MGTHVGSGADHTTQRVHDLSFRAGTALWGHMGVEWDLTAAPPAQRAALAQWIALHKRLRALLHTGRRRPRRPGQPRPPARRRRRPGRPRGALQALAVEHTLIWPPGRVTLPGLDPDRTYLVTIASPRPLPDPMAPPWAREGVRLSGEFTGSRGPAEPPFLMVDTLAVIHAAAVDA